MQSDYKAFVKQELTVEPHGSGILQGMTFAVKDVFAIAGHINSAGNPDWMKTHIPADKHAAAIELLLEQGAALRGVTQTDELMFSLNGENVHYGTPVNPKAPGRIPGGSSSGSAVAVSAGLADFALGTDTGGSVRIPSSYCGVYGIRPSHGFVPMEGVIPLSESFDTVGWMARDTGTLLDVGLALMKAERMESNGFKRVFFGTDAWAVVEAKCGEKLSKHVPMIADFFDESQWITIAPQGLSEWVDTFRTIQGYEIWMNHGDWITQEAPEFGPGIAERFIWTSTLEFADYERQTAARKQICTYMEELLGDDALLVIPTAPCTAPKLGLAGIEMESIRARVMQLSCVAGLTGLPQVTVPMAETEGMPIGLSVIAGRRQDAKLLSWIDETLAAMLPQQGAV